MATYFLTNEQIEIIKNSGTYKDLEDSIEKDIRIKIMQNIRPEIRHEIKRIIEEQLN